MARSMNYWVTCLILLLSLSSLPAQAEVSIPRLGESSALNLQKEYLLGRKLYLQLKQGGYLVEDPMLNRYLQDIGEQLLSGLDYRDRDYHFFIVNNNSVNAFAAPGGYIGVHAGLIRVVKSVDELAAVLAHEIAHVRLQHNMQIMEKAKKANLTALATVLAAIILSTQDIEAANAMVYTGMAGANQLMVNYTRANEYEADRIGVDILKKSEFDPYAMSDFMQYMLDREAGDEISQIEYLRTHPVSANRLAEIRSRLSDVEQKPKIDRGFIYFRDYLLSKASQSQEPVGESLYSTALNDFSFGRYEKAEQKINELLEKNPYNDWLLYLLGEIYRFQHKSDEALNLYSNALKLYPSDTVMSLRLAETWIDQGNPEKALKILHKLEVEQPGNTRIYELMIKIYDELSEPDLLLLARANYHWYNGELEQAAREFKILIKQQKVDIVELERIKSALELLKELGVKV